jgi:DNA-binding transcriptional MerR regulator
MQTGNPAARLRMRHLVERTGLSRETIHFYIAAGLVPPPRETKRNAAVYGEEHVARLNLVRELRERSFLPLKAIRELLAEGKHVRLAPEHRALMSEVGARLADGIGAAAGRVRLAEVLAKTGVRSAEALEFAKLGMIEIAGSGSAARVTREDAALLDVWGRLKAAGAFAERGIEPKHASVVRDGAWRLAADVMTAFGERYAGITPARGADVMASTLPLLNEMIGILHGKRLRRLFEEEGARPSSRAKRGSDPRRRGR